MKRNQLNFILLLLISLIISSCRTSKLGEKMSLNPMINSMVSDYYSKKKDYIRSYSIFHINDKNVEDLEIKVFTVVPENDKIAYILRIEDSLDNALPTDYLEYKGKVFFWKEANKKVPDSVIKYIYNKKLIDSSYLKFQMGLISEEDINEVTVTIDDEIEGVNYIFCKDNPSKIKKRIVSNRYVYPTDKMFKKVNCN